MAIVNLIGIGLIVLIAWWFWFYRPATVAEDSSDLVVTVDGGTYTPAHLQINPYVPVQITFVRKDASPCAEVIMFPALDISETLPVNQAVLIQLPALAPGKYAFHCQMQMYRGTLTVKPEG